MNLNELDISAIRQFAQVLEDVLSERTHKRVHLGEEIVVKGSLAKALKLPKLLKDLSSNKANIQEAAKDQFITLWTTLSQSTKDAVIRRVDWYDPQELDWDDPRSNRKPITEE